MCYWTAQNINFRNDGVAPIESRTPLVSICDDRICNVSKLKHYHVNRYSPEEIQKFLPASTQTCTMPNTASLQTTDQVADQVQTAVRGRDTTDQVVTTPATSSQDRTQPVNCFILPSSNSEQDNTRRTARNTRAPDFFQAGFG